MALSAQAKESILGASNCAILALCAAGVFQHWSQDKFNVFLGTKLGKILPLILVYPAFLAAMPLLPRPKAAQVPATASAPTIAQAKAMFFFTSLMDYLVVVFLFFVWDSACRLEDGSLCPFAASGTLFLGAATMSVKDEIQCRFLWRKYISPCKLISWPYTWSFSLEQVCVAAPFAFMNLLALSLAGWVSFESFLLQPQVLLRVWAETRATLAATDLIMHFVHRWMHEKAYFLHKRHHRSKADAVSFLSPSFDLMDLVLEFGAGIPLLLMIKATLGLDPRMHLLTHNMLLLVGFQHHSGNPYAVYLFNPLLDYLARSALCHNLHHAIQKDHLLFVPYSHFFSSDTRQKDIAVYNKCMKTNFPTSI